MRGCRLHSPNPQHMKPSSQSIRGAAASDAEWDPWRVFPYRIAFLLTINWIQKAVSLGRSSVEARLSVPPDLSNAFCLIHQKLSVHRKYIYTKLVLYNRFFVWIHHLWASFQNILHLFPNPHFWERQGDRLLGFVPTASAHVGHTFYWNKSSALKH